MCPSWLITRIVDTKYFRTKLQVFRSQVNAKLKTNNINNRR